MQIEPFPFQTLNWDPIEKIEHAGTTGHAIWQVTMMNEIRIRMIEYSANYLADHWCNKGHIIFCIAGEMQTLLEDGSRHLLTAGMTYHVGDNCEKHRSESKNGCKLFIVD